MTTHARLPGDHEFYVFEEPYDDGQIAVGRYSYCNGNPFVIGTPADRIEVGAFCSLATEVRILGSAEHCTDLPTTYPIRERLTRSEDGVWDIYSKGTTSLGNDVWVGWGAMVMSGSTIGHGSVIGARTVIAGDVPPYSIVAGNPGRVVRRRFDESVVERLLAVAWWDWPRDRIAALEPFFYSDVEVFLGEAERLPRPV